MDKLGTRAQAIICIALSWIGFVNCFVWIWMASKIRSGKMKIAGIATTIVFVVLLFTISLMPEQFNDGSLLMIVFMAIYFLPFFIIIAFMGEFVRAQDIEKSRNKYQINLDELKYYNFSSVRVPDNSKLLKTARRIYGSNGEILLQAIVFNENQKKEQAIQNKQEKTLKKQEEREAKALQQQREREQAQEERARKLEADRLAAQAEIEKAKTEQEKARAEAKRMELEKARAEAAARQHSQDEEKLRLEKERQEYEARRAETEKARLEAERLKAEAEKARAEAENLRAKVAAANAEKAKLQREAAQGGQRAAAREDNRTKQNMERPQPLLDINTCDENELSLVPGVGIILAKKAIAIRNERGRFQSVDDFIQSVGIREMQINTVKQHIVCSDDVPDQDANSRKRGRKIDL